MGLPRCSHQYPHLPCCLCCLRHTVLTYPLPLCPVQVARLFVTSNNIGSASPQVEVIADFYTDYFVLVRVVFSRVWAPAS